MGFSSGRKSIVFTGQNSLFAYLFSDIESLSQVIVQPPFLEGRQILKDSGYMFARKFSSESVPPSKAISGKKIVF